jgi:hypothetical protein
MKYQPDSSWNQIFPTCIQVKKKETGCTRMDHRRAMTALYIYIILYVLYISAKKYHKVLVVHQVQYMIIYFRNGKKYY